MNWKNASTDFPKDGEQVMCRNGEKQGLGYCSTVKDIFDSSKEYHWWHSTIGSDVKEWTSLEEWKRNLTI